MVENTSIDSMNDSLYKIYFYSQPHFLVLDTDSVVDINLISDKNKIIEIIFSDVFFELNLKKTKCKDWSLTIQIFDKDNKFTSQIDLNGENMKVSNTKKGKKIKFNYDQITNNNGWASVPKVFEKAEFDYMNYKISYLRDKKLKEIFL